MANIIVECKNCKKPFGAKSKKAEFCTTLCRNEYIIRSSGNLNDDYIICELCHRAVASVSGIHMRTYHPEYTPELYRKEFPNSLITPRNVSILKSAGAKKAGARMREPEHRKRLSESYKGEKNPMHKTNVDEEFRKSISPFSPNFYQKRFPNLSLDECKKLAEDKQKSVVKVSQTQIGYWIKKGFSEEEAKNKISELQKTFSLEICIRKYGEEEGKKRWLDRQERWAKNYKKFNYSKKSQDLFIKIYSEIKDDFKEIYFATLKSKNLFKDPEERRNYEKVIKIDELVLVPDFFIPESKKIIEFDGVYWHDYKRRNKPENKKREEYKDKKLIESEYKILRITELEWDNDPDQTIKKCIKFIYD